VALPFGGQLMPGSNNFSMLDAFMTQIFTQTVEEELNPNPDKPEPNRNTI
jgi:hypothetical protein